MVTVNCVIHGITLGTYNDNPEQRRCIKCKEQDRRDMQEALERIRSAEGAYNFMDPDQGDIFDVGAA